MGTRLYAVKVIVGTEIRQYLVDATTKGSAKNYVADKHVAAEIADGKTVAYLMARGVAPESATSDPLTEPIE